MKSSLIVKINFLLMGLGLTAYIIYVLNTHGLSPRLQALFGFQPTAAISQSHLSWCETRVAALIRPNEMELTQEGDKWISKGQAQHELDFISVEKWFGKYCSVGISAAQTSSQEGFSPALIVKFITGQVEVLKLDPSGAFRWRDQTFTSPDLTVGLSELMALPEAKR